MWLSDVSVKRPVFATVISMLLVAFGVLSFNYLPLRSYPDADRPIVSVRTNYLGASADVIESRITQVLEDQISGVGGIESIDSSSRDERSSISIEFGLDRDIDQAANDVRDRVSRALDRLPEGVEPPEVSKSDSDASAALYINLTSTELSLMDLHDYVDRYILDRFSVISGVAAATISSSAAPSMRIWLDRMALAARDLTVSDIETAMRRENVELPAGIVDSGTREFRVRLKRSYQTPEDFRQLVIRQGADGHLIRLGEVADVALAPRSLRNSFRTNQETTVGIRIAKQSTANILETLEAVKAEVEEVRLGLPRHMDILTSSDISLFIREAINSVYQTIGITTVLVSLVILAFLGSFRAMVIPAITIPVCLTSAFIALAAFGYSVNLITLLALVLCIGLVVDDAIVVLENIYRRVEKGEPPLLAAYKGSRQVAFAVVATTLVLISVFTPIAFLQDSRGAIFSELAVTISAAVIFSTVLALSLTPVMCVKLLHKQSKPNRFTRTVDATFRNLEQLYLGSLRGFMKHSWLAVVITLAVVGGAGWLKLQVPDEYAPNEDRGMFSANIIAPEGTGIETMRGYMDQIEDPMMQMLKDGDLQRMIAVVPSWRSSSPNSGAIFVQMAPWRERKISTQEAINRANEAWREVPGVQAYAYVFTGMSSGGGRGQPVQLALGGPSYELLAEWRDIIMQRAEAYPGLDRMDSNLNETQPQLAVRVDKNRAAALGVSVANVGRTLSTMMSERRISTYVKDGEEYDVIMQTKDEQRASAEDLQNIYVRSETSGQLIPLSNLIYVEETAGAASLNRYNRLRSVTLSANLANGYTLGEALAFLERTVAEELPDIAQIDYRGESLEFKEASGSLLFTFGIALMIVFLVLAAQFESFVQPLVILLTVPMAVAGAFLGLALTDSTLNIYSQIGLLILIGIATKNGVLIVEFINQLRDAGRKFEDAILEAASIRLRPVIMTTFSTAMGSLPLILASGAGSESRNVLGIVIFFGVSLATLLTLFIVPAFYKLLARNSGSPRTVSRLLEQMSGTP